MTRYLFILGLITTGVILSGFINIMLPVSMVNALTDWFAGFYAWDGFIPVAEIVSCAIFFLWVQVGIGAFALFKWIVG